MAGSVSVVGFVVKFPWNVWFGTGVAVSLISPRLLSLSVSYLMPVTGNEFDAVVFAKRPAPKNQTLSGMIGPPAVASYVGLRTLVRVVLCCTSNGVIALQVGFARFTRKLPENRLPPLLVMALTTPPEKRPYSAEIPDVSTCVSWIASSMKTFCGEPNRLSFTSMPLIMNRLS